MAQLPPLALYIHIPWCVRRCPYCDFNAHTDARNSGAALDGGLEAAYLDALRLDLADSAPQAAGRELVSIFFGGGTPSLMSAPAIGAILDAVRQHFHCLAEPEITLEANPGALESGRFAALRGVGVNRLSLGVQSFDDAALERLGRIHSARQAALAIRRAQRAGFERLNVDLMYGLPEQTPEQGLADLQRVLDMGVRHLSWYELTVEPNTPFYRQPPPRPPEDHLEQLQSRGAALLTKAALEQYEVSAWAAAGHACRHNLNYWQFGDYLGIGAGAHSKITPPGGHTQRYARLRQPAAYMSRPCTRTVQPVNDPLGEYLMNALRLVGGFALADCAARTLMAPALVEARLQRLEERQFVSMQGGQVRPTALGLRFLNEALLA